jgi:RNA polymerase sigma-70 factor, ECF subfamily
LRGKREAVSGNTSEREFTEAAERHRRELLVHCYQMLGSVQEAEDLVQETMLRAWRSYDSYDPDRASMRTWLYRIATNACLNALEGRARRPLPSGVGQRFDDPDAPFVPGFEVPWLQPIPDRILGAGPEDPAVLAAERSGLRLAVVAALQLLPAKQRAVLILREVLDFAAAEVASMLGMSTAAVNSALQRARATFSGPGLDADTLKEPEAAQRAVVDRYMAAFERADVAELTRMLAEEVVLEMPPMWNWYLGTTDYARFMDRVFDMRGRDWRAFPTQANSQPAIVAYNRQGEQYILHSLQVFLVEGGLVLRNTVYQDPQVLGLFDFPNVLP